MKHIGYTTTITIDKFIVVNNCLLKFLFNNIVYRLLTMATNDLDKFKRRLIRNVRRLIDENTPENELWQNLKDINGCDCFVLWYV